MGNFTQKMAGNTVLTLFFCILIAITVVFTPPRWASNLPICTDSVEYAIGAENIVETGRFFICVRGEELPSRYPPWFSLIAIAPGYVIFGREPGNAIIPITCFSIIGVIASFLIGYRISGKWGGFVSSLVLLLLPAYRAYSHHVMTEIPCSSIALVLSFLYLEMRSIQTASVRFYAISGIIAGLASAFRPACSVFVLPFLLLTLKIKIFSSLSLRILLLIVPQLIVAGATMLYNLKTFGSISKTGYNFWCSGTFSNLHLVFSPSFLKANLAELFISGLPALALTTCCLWVGYNYSRNGFPRDKRETAKSLIYYLALGTGPIVLLHLFYFWDDQRFFLPTLTVLAALTGGLFGIVIENMSNRLLLGIQIILMVAAFTFRLVHTPTDLMRRATADRIIKMTPPNALVVSAIDPVYLEYFICRGSQRRVLPLSRNVDYTSTTVVWQTSITMNTKSGSNVTSDITPAGLYPYVAVERPDLLVNEIRKGIPVFMDTSQIPESDGGTVEFISRHFNLVQRAQYLYELRVK
ncbi:MAG: glycosyltransferase family 39 protein [Kiritimatiellae bacterium]|nr:glycosyltransferase family 39 protein [Kiritimatiellia bacterium]MDD5522849.1 glycosyltransferase family 39 protein [Kiritimatiellia bacterium]